MGFTIKPEYWLKTETDKVQGIVLMAENWSTTWTDATLQKFMEGKGVNYTVDQCAKILEELVTRKVIA